MKITYNISAALVLGTLVSVALPLEAGEGGSAFVEFIPFPDEAGSWLNANFSDDGQLRLLHTYVQNNSDIYRYEDGEWTLIRRELWTPVPGLTPMSVSLDGSVIVLTDFFRTDVLAGSSALTMPRTWSIPEQHNGHSYDTRVWGTVRGGDVSRDGQIVTMSGWETDRHDGDSLVWMGGDDLVNISAPLPREDHSYAAGIPDADGSVIAFEAETPTGIQIWVWEDDQLTQIPALDPDIEPRRSLWAVSADGQAVFGNDDGPRRGALGWGSEPLSEDTAWSSPSYRASTAWKWSQTDGIVEIIDRSRFLETTLIDTDANGDVALVRARPLGSNFARPYLWLGGNNFLLVDDILKAYGVSIEADFYGFNEISDDGTKLMGLAAVDGQTYSHAIIVTIPDLTP